MMSTEFSRLFKNHIKSMIFSGMFFGAIVSSTFVVFEKPYIVNTDFLMVQQNSGNQDFYTLFKSSEYLGKVLSEAIYSERFIDAVIETGKVNDEFFPKDKKDRLDSWAKMIHVEKNLELGILKVSVKSNSERDAARIMSAVSEVLTQRNELFRAGDPKSVEIRILSGPISERNPSLQKIALVFAGSFLSGVLLVGCLAALRTNNKEILIASKGIHDFNS